AGGERERQAGGGAGRLYARQRRDAFEQPREEAGHFRTSAVARRRQRDAQRQHPRRVAARGLRHQTGEALEQQSARNQQHDGDRDLRDDERLPHATAAGVGASTSAVLQRRGDRDARQARRGDEPEQDAGGDAERRSDEQHRAIERHGGEARQRARRDAEDAALAPAGDGQPREGAGQRQQHRFSQQLADDAKAAGPE